jgi:type II secretory pathway pseudopilin PulG
LLAVAAALALLAALVVPLVVRVRAKSRLAQCTANLQQISRAVTLYANENEGRLPELTNAPAPGGWWHYREQVKGYLGLKGPASAEEAVFGCPSDRGYGDEAGRPVPFRLDRKHLFTSYVFNGVNHVPGIPNIAGRTLASVKDPQKTLLVMEWTAHAPLSWHQSRTGSHNTPFYSGAESVAAFADGRVALTPIYFDGLNPAYTRDPIGGYAYKFSGD